MGLKETARSRFDAINADVAENGKIKLLRESLDLVRAARAMLPNGVADIPADQ
ncbi:hypothetical protein [Micromonospora sp. NPDC048839]|uniref:hypothetical protein n=1 Tax=Micromonospora sp. NPDC048839 TaxID=3155641 RepID=UPI0033E6DE63